MQMKKYVFFVLFLSIFFFGCGKNAVSSIDINAIDDLDTLQQTITTVSDALDAGTLPKDEAQLLLAQLEQKYIDLTETSDTSIDDQLTAIHVSMDKYYLSSSLPLRARRMGMSVPQEMQIDASLSKHIVRDDGYESTVLVYSGSYEIAMQQADSIAKKAHLSASKEFQQAQSIVKTGNVRYISGLDVGEFSSGIVYINHELLDTDIDTFLSVSVDQNGLLTIEATKYK